MDFDPNLNAGLDEALKSVREGRLAGKKDEELPRMVTVLQNYLACEFHPPPAIKSSIEAIENELARRQKDKHQEDSKTLHQSAMDQGKNFHGETMDKLKEIKDSVDQLARPRWIDWAILIVGAIAAIGVVISLFLIH
jgi:hypothetical protein